MELLATTNVVERLKIVSTFLGRQSDLELEGQDPVRSQVGDGQDRASTSCASSSRRSQRELGPRTTRSKPEINELREKVEAAGMTEEVKARALRKSIA